MARCVIALVAATAVAAVGAAPQVRDLDTSTFDAALASDDALLVKFFAPWCGHCKNLAPAWAKLPEELDGKTNVDGAAVQVAKVDCTSPSAKDVCSRAGVRGFPTVKLFFRGHAYDHSGGRSVAALSDFALRGFVDAKATPFAANTAEVAADGAVGGAEDLKVGLGEEEVLIGAAPSKESEVVELTDDTFEHDTQAATGATTGAWLVQFYAPWCPHCKAFAPSYEKIARALKSQGVPVTVAKLDVTSSPVTARRFGVLSYPTLRLFKDGRVWEFPADKGRSVVSIVNFAKSGYKASPSEEVPPPTTIWTQLQGEMAQAAGDVATLARSNPNAVVLLAGAAFLCGMLVMLVVTIVTSALVPLEPLAPADIQAAASRASRQAESDDEDEGEDKDKATDE